MRDLYVIRDARWNPNVGMGPSLNFIHQGASSGDVSFSNFDYKTGFNVFVGGDNEEGRSSG